MQNRWYSDNRDLVKWAALLHLARACPGATSIASDVAFFALCKPRVNKNTRHYEK
jgi:hypothetical protein